MKVCLDQHIFDVEQFTVFALDMSAEEARELVEYIGSFIAGKEYERYAFTLPIRKPKRKER